MKDFNIELRQTLFYQHIKMHHSKTWVTSFNNATVSMLFTTWIWKVRKTSDSWLCLQKQGRSV